MTMSDTGRMALSFDPIDACNTAYYSGNREALDEILDDLVFVAAPIEGEDEAPVFASLVRALARNPDKAVIIAASAMLRLARLSAPTERNP